MKDIISIITVERHALDSTELLTTVHKNHKDDTNLFAKNELLLLTEITEKE